MAVSVGRDVCVLRGGAKSRKSGEDARKTSKVETGREGADSGFVTGMSLGRPKRDVASTVCHVG
jgi:hypothetical protein